MPSHLTRRVFRCLIANEHILHSGCLRRQAIGRLRGSHGTPVTSSHCHTQQRRSLFSFPNILSRPSNDQAGVRVEPGLDVMTDYERKKRMRARLPDIRDIDSAIWSFLDNKLKAVVPSLPDTQAKLLLDNLQYIVLESQPERDGEDAAQVAKYLDRSLRLAGKLLMRHKTPFVPVHQDLAQLVADASRSKDLSTRSFCTYGLIITLCRAGKPSEASRALVESGLVASGPSGVSNSQDGAETESDQNLKAPRGLLHGLKECLRELTAAFALQDDESSMLSTLNISSLADLKRDDRAVASVVAFYCKKHKAPEIERWMDVFLTDCKGAGNALSRHVRQMLEYCSQSQYQDIGKRIVRKIMNANPEKAIWDEVLAWDFARTKSVDELNRQLDVMLNSNDEDAPPDRQHLPDIASINRFIEVAVASNDPYLAERLINLGKDRGLHPDARTLLLQMQYRLTVNDLDGALNAYKHLQTHDTSNNEDIPAVNRLIVALCHSKRHDFDTIMNVAADLSDRRADFDALTVQNLALLHLKRDELQDVQDLIKTHAHRFSSTERTALRAAIREFCLDMTTPLANLWDAYSILQNDFDEMPREERMQIMQSCFDRRRPDMAIHIFSHMRMHSRDDTYPDASTYKAALLGAAQLKDVETLTAFHNQLKIDPTITITTGIRNALMLGFIATGQAGRAIRVWDDIEASREGPTYSSILIALRACGRTRFGDLKAQSIWKRLRTNNIDLDQSLWAAYIAALAGNDNVTSAIAVLEDAAQHHLVDVDALVIGRLYNTGILIGKARQIEQWAKLEYPEIWASLAPALTRGKGNYGQTVPQFELDDDEIVP